MKPLNYALTLIFGIGIGWTLAVSHQSKIPPKEVSTQLRAEPTQAVTPLPQKPLETVSQLPSAITQPKSNESKKTRLATLTEDFWKAFNDNDFDKARATVEEMGRVAKDGKEFNEGLTRILVRTRDYDNAKPALDHCLELFPKSKSCLTDMVDVELQIGTRDEQLRAAQSCLANYPDYPQCLNDLAIVRMHEGNFPDAVTIYEKLMASNGSFGFRFNLEMLHSQLGYALEGAGRIAEATQQFDIACRSNWSGACAKYEELSHRF